MTGVDSSEIILLLIIGLIVLGPKRLPEIANKLGSWIGQARRMTRVMKRQLEDELALDRRSTASKPAFSPPPVIGAPKPAPEADTAEDGDDHIPHDDDSYSPVHDGESREEEEDRDKSA
jgi:sec-independent protein translocase protein TatB